MGSSRVFISINLFLNISKLPVTADGSNAKTSSQSSGMHVKHILGFIHTKEVPAVETFIPEDRAVEILYRNPGNIVII